MPDTKTSTRWEQKDKPALVKAFKAAGVPARVVNAQGDAQKQKTQADQCIADGAKVLIIAPIDSGSARRSRRPPSSRRQVDRLRPPGRRRRRRSLRVVRRPHGRRDAGQARHRRPEGDRRCTARSRSSPRCREAEDANAFLFKGGVDSVMNPLYRNGTFVKGPQQFVPGWNNRTAATIFQQMLVRTSNKIDAVAAADDGIAGASRRGPEGGEAGSDPAERPGRDHRGCQEHHLGLADRVAVEGPARAGSRDGEGRDCHRQGRSPVDRVCDHEGRPKELAYLISPIQLTKANWKRVITSGYYKRSEICNGEYAKYC